MDQHNDIPSACPALVSRGARLLAGVAVLAGFVLAAQVTVASSRDAVERKLVEFDEAPALLAHGSGADKAGQARVASSPAARYDAANNEEDANGCERPGRHPG